MNKNKEHKIKIIENIQVIKNKQNITCITSSIFLQDFIKFIFFCIYFFGTVLVSYPGPIMKGLSTIMANVCDCKSLYDGSTPSSTYKYFSVLQWVISIQFMGYKDYRSIIFIFEIFLKGETLSCISSKIVFEKIQTLGTFLLFTLKKKKGQKRNCCYCCCFTT